MKVNKIWDDYPEIKNDLEEVLSVILKNINVKDKKIENSIKELVYSGGKLLRPAFSLISARFGDYNREQSIAVAAALEVLHMATLVHDDIIDESKTRRGQESFQSKYGKDYAVYIGDYLFCVCFKILASHSASLSSIKIDSRVMEKICLGEIDQMNSKFDFHMSVKKYLSRISGKTAELFALSFYSGAAESGCDKFIARTFWRIGHNIGIAFQIIDDVLDYTATASILGKPASADIKQGIFNLPLIYAINSDRNTFINLLDKDIINDSDIQKVIKLVYEYKGVEKAIELADKYTKKAFKLIDKLPNNEYKEVMKEITGLLLNRKY